MDLTNLKVGMNIKNYKEMCDILKEESTTGKSKQLQLERWLRYFDYEKDGHKFVIKEIYDTPLPEDFSTNDIYSKYIQTILTKYLKEKGSGEFTMTQLLKLCGFVNENWNNLTLLHKYIENKDITYAQAIYYYNQLCYHVYTYCNKALVRCLDRLYKRGFLRWNKVLYIRKDNDTHIASKEETKKYLDVTMKVREEMNIKYVNLYNRDEYYRKVDSLLEEKYKWNKAYEVIQIIYAPSYIDSMIKESEDEYRKALLEVNDHCLMQMYKYVDVDIENDIKKLANRMNEDIEIARLCTDVETVKENKINITDIYIDLKSTEIFNN